MHEFNWFGWFVESVNHHNIHIYTASFVAALLILMGLVYKKSLKTTDLEVIPTGDASAKNIIQSAVEAIFGMVESIIGHDAKKYFPLIGGIFIYIFVNNLMGIFPGMLPATENINTNLACSLTVFLYYNFVGIKEQGVTNYLKHFMGPIIFLAPLMFVIELISHMVRPVALALRLFGNINGDHLVLGIFSGLVPLGIPVLFLGLGLFVALVQAFVFSLLSTIYIGLSVAHEDHH